jgi:hypothetical protein
MSSSSRIRKFDSGYEKRKKKKRLEALAQSQKGALDRYVIKENQSSAEDQTLQMGIDENIGDNTNNASNVEAHTSEIDENTNNVDGVVVTIKGSNSTEIDTDLRERDDFQPDIFDPRYWDWLDRKLVDILVQKGPKRDLSIQKGPRDKLNRRFSAALFTRVLSNGETCDREWLVYSKELDKVFCFCCKLLRKGHLKSQ